MKYIKTLIFTLFLLLPLSVNAHELKCDAGTYNYNDTFRCYVTTDPNLYDELSGTITTDEHLNCQVFEKDPNLSGAIYKDSFSLLGTTIQNKSIVTISCQVVSKPTEGKQSQLLINNFKTHVKDTTYVASEEVLRSNYVTIAPYSEQQEEEKDTKPRDTSNPDATLKLVSDPQLDFNFSKIRTTYNIEVLYEVEQLNLTVYPFNSLATYRIEGDQKLSVGENVIDIYVTSPDGSTTTCYTLNIKRLARGQTIYYKESDSTLNSLTIQGHDIKFEAIILEYTVVINHDVEKLNINATPNVATADVDIQGNDKLKNNDKITINITSEDGTSVSTYIIHIKKKAPPKDYTQEITIGIIVIIGIALLLLFIGINKKEKEDDLLKIKHDKRRVKKGQKFDANSVESVESNGELNKIVSAEKPQNIVINENNVVQPTQTVEQVDTNFNKVTPVQASVNLQASQQAAPIQVTEPVQVENTIVSGLAANAPTLDLTNTNVESAMVQYQQEPSAFNMAPTPDTYVEMPPEQLPEAPTILQQVIQGNDSLQDTSILPVTPTDYVLPEDQALQATQQMPIVQGEIPDLPPIDMVNPPKE